jgi:hypothetical protein
MLPDALGKAREMKFAEFGAAENRSRSNQLTVATHIIAAIAAIHPNRGALLKKRARLVSGWPGAGGTIIGFPAGSAIVSDTVASEAPVSEAIRRNSGT